MSVSSDIVAVVVAATGTVASIVDVRARRVPNVLTAPLAVGGLLLAAADLSGVTVGGALLGMAVGCGLMLPGHAWGATGAGDVKLQSAFGALLGPYVVMTAFLYAAIVGGALAVAYALRRRHLKAVLQDVGRIVVGSAGRERPSSARRDARVFPYAPAIAAGALLAALWP